MAELSIQVADTAGVRTIVLNRPERRNAMTAAMQEEIISAMESAEASEIRVLVFRGAGDAFCSGLDLNTLQPAAQDSKVYREDAERLARLFRTLYELPIPTIAVVHGPAIAGGTGLATLCDFTIATPEARFGYTEPRIGFVPAIVSVFLSLLVGQKSCRDLLVSARVFDAQEAFRLGLVTELVDAEQLPDRVHGLTRALIRNSPKSLASIKRSLATYHKEFLDDALSRAIEESVTFRNSEDCHEGVSAFFAKRDPYWAK
jgi:methylglutaconyl-CoA hydratase